MNALTGLRLGVLVAYPAGDGLTLALQLVGAGEDRPRAIGGHAAKFPAAAGHGIERVHPGHGIGFAGRAFARELLGSSLRGLIATLAFFGPLLLLFRSLATGILDTGEERSPACGRRGPPNQCIHGRNLSALRRRV
jgi:hypothetical protein